MFLNTWFHEFPIPNFEFLDQSERTLQISKSCSDWLKTREKEMGITSMKMNKHRAADFVPKTI